MFTETLESRTLMSASPISTQVAADRLQVRADLLRFKADALSDTAVIMTDVAALKADGLKNDATLVPLFKQLHKDLVQMWTQLRIDRLTEAGNVLKDQSVIVTELVQLLKDRGNPTAVTADKAVLLTDRIHLQNDEITGLNTRLTTRQNAYNKIFADLDQITTGVADDNNASPALVAEAQKFAVDRTNCLNTMSADLTKLIADRTQLVTDLTALQNS
jgi:uncharacterized coiled-coil protein SlyX